MSENYVMPKVSAIIQESGKLSAGARYLAEPKIQHTGNVEKFFYYVFSVSSLLVMTSLFIASMCFTVYTLDSASKSPTVISLKTQEVPSNGIDSKIILEHKIVKSVDKG